MAGSTNIIEGPLSEDSFEIFATLGMGTRIMSVLAQLSFYSKRECSFTIEQYVNNILLFCPLLLCVCVCVYLPKECQAYCDFLPSAV